MVNTTYLRTLCEVVREGSFAGAARRLGYTSSAVSQHIAVLERTIGVTLFEREARGIRTTAAAVFAAQKGEELLMQLDDFEDMLANLAGGHRGRLQLGSFPTANSRIVPKVLARIMASHPHAEVGLDEGNTEPLVTGVLEGHIDLAVVHVYALVPETWPPGLTAVELANEDLLLMLPADHRLAGEATPRLEQLRSERWISSQNGTAAGMCLQRICAAHGFVPTVAFRSDDYNVVQGLVRAGAGVAIVPEMGCTPDDKVVCVPLTQWRPGRQILALHRRTNTNPILATGIAALHESFGH